MRLSARMVFSFSLVFLLFVVARLQYFSLVNFGISRNKVAVNVAREAPNNTVNPTYTALLFLCLIAQKNQLRSGELPWR